MKHIFLHKTMLVIFSLTVTLLSGCINDPEPAPLPPGTETGMYLTLALDVPSGFGEHAGSRSVGSLESGEGFENMIDFSKAMYRIYFFDMDNKLITKFNTITTIGNNGNDSYNVTGEVPKSLLAYKNFKVVVFANLRNNYLLSENKLSFSPGVTTLQELCNAEFTKFDWAQNAYTLSAENMIPFYGVREYTNITFLTPQTTVLPQPVMMLRSVAKMEVTLETDLSESNYENLDFKWFDLTPCNYIGYSAPDNVLSNEDYNSASGYFGSPHLTGANNTNIGTDNNMYFNRVKVWDEGGKRLRKYVTYLYEYNNEIITTPEYYSRLRFQFNHELQVESNGAYFVYITKDGTNNLIAENRINIVRNNIYRIRIVVSGGIVRAKLNVVDWTGYDNNFDYGDGQVVSPVAPWDDKIDNNYVY